MNIVTLRLKRPADKLGDELDDKAMRRLSLLLRGRTCVSTSHPLNDQYVFFIDYMSRCELQQHIIAEGVSQYKIRQ